MDSYSETNQNADYDISGYNDNVGQSFTGDGNDIVSVKFYLRRVGISVEDVLVAKLYSHSGTYGTSSVAGTLLATSETHPDTDLTTSYQLITFNFSGSDIHTTTNGTKYVIRIETLFYGNGRNYIEAGYDNSSPTHDGNMSDGSTAFSTADLCFYIETTAVSTDSSRPAEITGGIDTNTSRPSEIHGTDDASSTRPAEVRGSVITNASRSAQVEGALAPTLTAVQDGTTIALEWTYT